MTRRASGRSVHDAAAPPTPITRRAALRGLAASAGLTLLAACLPPPPPPGGVVSPAPTPLPTLPLSVSPSAAPVAPQRPAPESLGGAATLAIPAEPDSLDPANALTLAAVVVGRPIFDGLLNPGPDLSPRPALAERWSVSQDGLLYTFFLRPGVTFQDGTPFDAAAAQTNLGRLIGDERPRRRGLLADVVRSVAAVDSLRLEVALDRPLPSLPRRLAQLGAAMVSPAALGGDLRALARGPVGTGPFRLAEWSPGSLVLERWDNSWRGRPALDRLVFRVESDPSARLQQLEVGALDLAGPLPADLLPRLQQHSHLAVETVLSARVLGLAINTRAEPFSDRRVRQALNFALDRDALAVAVFGGAATPLGGPLSPAIPGAASLPPYPFDPDRARLLLAEAGLAAGLEAPLVAPHGRFPRDAALAQELQRQFQAVGIRLRLELLDGPGYTAALTRPVGETSLRLALVNSLPADGHAAAALLTRFHSSHWVPRGENASFYRNDRLDGLLQAAAASADPAESRPLREAQELIREEAPWVFLLTPHLVAARSANLRGVLLGADEVVTLDEHSWLAADHQVPAVGGG